MANTVIALKKSATPSATPASLANGELAINYADGKLFYKHANGTIISFSSGGNAFGTVNANNTLVVADSPSSILTVVPGNNISIVGDAVNDKVTVGLKDDVTIPGLLSITASSGDEGGEIRLANAVTNSLLAGPVNIDIFRNQLRFFVSGGDARGAYINLAATGAGVGTDLLASASATDTTARDWAASAFAKANNALANTSGVTFNGNLTVSQNLSADRVFTTNNGNGENIKIGDDAWIGDFNTTNSIRIKGQQNPSDGYINFGVDDAKLLGRSGTGPLTYDGNTVWHAGNDGSGSTLDADLLDGQHGSYYGTATNVTSAFDKANTALTTGQSAFGTANLAYAKANTANITADLAFGKANTANITADAAFGTANLAFAKANTANITADLAFGKANTANITADLAFGKANTANITADLAYGQANTARTHANAAHLTANAGFDQANTARTHANNAYNTANTAWAVANSKFSSNGGSISGDVSITGNLTLSGNTNFINVSTYIISDPLIYLAGNNYTSDIVDIGFIGNYVNTTGANVHTGLYREHEDKMYYLFNGYDKEPINNHIGALSNNMTLAVLNADLKTSNLLLSGVNATTWIVSAFGTANLAYAKANTANITADLAFGKANTANITADLAFGKANTANITADLAYGQANTARTHANAAHLTANAGYGQANTARDHANAAFAKANTSSGGAYYSGNNGDVGSASGLGDIFRVHTNTLTANVTIYSGNNALAAGPITIASGKTLTIQSNARVAIV